MIETYNKGGSFKQGAVRLDKLDPLRGLFLRWRNSVGFRVILIT